MVTTIPNNIKKEIWSNFEEFQPIFLATTEKDKPRVRPVTLAFLDSRFWVFTGTKDAKVKQIRANPKIEFCYLFKKGENSGYVRANGIAKITQDQKIKEQMANRCDYFDQHWKGPNDPNYTLLEFEIEEIEYMEPGKILAKKYRL